MKLSKYQQRIIDDLRTGGKIRNVFGSYYWKRKKLRDETIDAIIATGETKQVKIVGRYLTDWFVVHETFDGGEV